MFVPDFPMGGSLIAPLWGIPGSRLMEICVYCRGRKHMGEIWDLLMLVQHLYWMGFTSTFIGCEN